jgi:hypothetical protein
LSFTPQDQANAVAICLLFGVALMLLGEWAHNNRDLNPVLYFLLVFAGFGIAAKAGYRLRQAAGGTKPFTGRRIS